MDIHVYIHSPQDSQTQQMLQQILTKLNSIENKENHVSQELDALTAQVAQNTSVEQSAITLIQGLAAQIAAAGTDPAKLSALTSSLSASASALAAAVAANTTPVAPPAA